ncbi:hypothetical protein RRG08_053012 [Elysia crispata]|uniref:Morc S5 domain-containing protein n=1 Tax=Elysia crispata TaxID=231223 RepID=A0AAE0YK59_9GAST|nr:hypothetical protein RRG08_053012 [Elysia crispata]
MLIDLAHLMSSLFGGITERPDLVTWGCPRGEGCISGRTVALVSVASGEADLGAAEEESGALETLRTGESNLKAILEHSVFRDENELKKELKGYRTGTKILIWNLKRVEDDILELDFASDVKDIRCPKAFETVLTSVHDRPVEQNKSEYMHSLREYCSILYLKPKMKIIIRGHKVKRRNMSSV